MPSVMSENPMERPAAKADQASDMAGRASSSSPCRRMASCTTGARTATRAWASCCSDLSSAVRIFDGRRRPLSKPNRPTSWTTAQQNWFLLGYPDGSPFCMKKIALIEDDPDLYTLLEYNLKREGFAICGSKSGKGAEELCRRERPDLIILDIMLPENDGLEICRSIRSHSEIAHTPIFFLTARGSEADRIVGLEIGANDYIVKPFFLRELVARVKNQLRTHTSTTRILRTGNCRVQLRGREVALTATEFRLLEFLMSRPGVVYSREQLLNAVWGHDRAVTDRTVDVYILRLRQKVEPDPASPMFIRAVRGFGYSFEPRNQEAAMEVVAG